jgi:hypothetical protein
MQFGAQHGVAPCASAIQAGIASDKRLIVLRKIVHDSRAPGQSFSRVMARMQQKGREFRPFWFFKMFQSASCGHQVRN